MTTPAKGTKVKIKKTYKTHPNLDRILTDGNWYRKLIETMDDGIIATDMNRNIIYVNPAVCKKLGYTDEELLGMNSLDIVVEEDRDRVARESEIRFSEKVSSQYEITFKTSGSWAFFFEFVPAVRGWKLPEMMPVSFGCRRGLPDAVL